MAIGYKLLLIILNKGGSFIEPQSLFTLDILKERTIQSFILNSNYGEKERKFFDNFLKTCFWNELKNLDLFGDSFETTLAFLKSLPPNLEKLKVSLYESNSKQFGLEGNDEVKRFSLKELVINIRYKNECTKDWGQLLLFFPHLEKLTLNATDNSLNSFEIKNENLKELEISCCSMTDEDNFIRKLIDSAILE